MKQLLLLAALVPVLVWSSNSFTDESSGTKRPLDLPAGGTGTTSEDEDIPETINFFGTEFEGDGFFWCFSAYEFWGNPTPFKLLKEEVARGVSQLSPKSMFDLVCYNKQGNDQVWQPRAQRATAAKKQNAMSWVTSRDPIEEHCMISAMKKTIDICNQTKKQARYKRMIFMGNRHPFCNGSGWGSTSYSDSVLEEVTAYNTKRVPIDTVYVPEWTYEQGEDFWKELASLNNGNYTKVIGGGYNND